MVVVFSLFFLKFLHPPGAHIYHLQALSRKSPSRANHIIQVRQYWVITAFSFPASGSR